MLSLKYKPKDIVKTRNSPIAWMMMVLRPIGVIHSPYGEKGLEAPPQGRHRPEEVSEIEVFKEYAEGLKDVEGFSHLIILYWCHKSEKYMLLQETPWDTKPHGVFATRSQHRPNPIGLTVVELVERRGNLLTVKGLDAIDGTPLLDIKPYIPSIDSYPEAATGWMKNKFKT